MDWIGIGHRDRGVRGGVCAMVKGGGPDSDLAGGAFGGDLSILGLVVSVGTAT